MTAQELFLKHLSFVGKPPSAEDALLVYQENVVMEFPYAPPEHTRRLEGPVAITGFLARIPTFALGFALSDPTLLETKNGLVALYHGDAVFKGSGRPYSQDYVAVVTVESGRISHIAEHYDPMRVLRAMGEID